MIKQKAIYIIAPINFNTDQKKNKNDNTLK